MIPYNHLVFIALSCLVLSSALCRAVNGRSDASVRCFDREREALLQFKRGITYDTCGMLTSWMREADCCQWRGVRCSNHTGHVIALDINGSESEGCLQGHIPPWIGNGLPNLGALSLRRNKFLGELPLSLCRLSRLQILNLSGNNISGIIPKCVHGLRAMGKMRDCSLVFTLFGGSMGDLHQPLYFLPETVTMTWKREEQTFKRSIGLVKSIDFSDNELTGEIPDGITHLTGLVSLDFSGNKLTGNLPPAIGKLSELEFLDFSNNQLTGNIPESLAKVSSLGTFNVSNNKLSGQIPLSTQLQGFDPSSYTGNPGLCGAPLPECPGDRAPADARHRFDSTTSQDKHDDDGVFPGLYISVVFGLIVGFWGVCGTLAVKRSLRWAYFRLLDDIYDRVYVITVLFVVKVWRKP